jgi:hypothetical protein
MGGKRRNIEKMDRNKKRAERRRSWEEEKLGRSGDVRGEEGKGEGRRKGWEQGEDEEDRKMKRLEKRRQKREGGENGKKKELGRRKDGKKWRFALREGKKEREE